MRRVMVAVTVVGCALLGGPPGGLAAQQGQGERPRVFFDCDGPRCDDDYYRTEIAWVDWVRDRTDADVHVIMTSQGTGAGGREFQLDLIGRGGEADYEDQVFHRSLSTDTEREELDGVAHALALALARFAAAAGFRGLVEIEAGEGVAMTDRVVGADEVDDPWNLWVFRVGGSGDFSGEETQKRTSLNSFFSASRVTPTWKQSYSGRFGFDRQEFERSDSTLFVDKRTEWNVNGLAVYALADHWSLGARVNSGRLPRFNQSFRLSVTPALEYSFFPYAEATRRSLTVYYQIGPTYRKYFEETVFGETAETRFEESIELEFSQRQPWGEASVRIQGSHFLDDFSQNSLSLRGEIDFRIVRGLSVNAEANVGWINDQIFLSAGGETDEEILLRLRQRGTDYSYGVELGFSYQFGSIFNNVVNNRFGGGGGFFGFGGGRGGF